jgi:hypothetical protein
MWTKRAMEISLEGRTRAGSSADEPIVAQIYLACLVIRVTGCFDGSRMAAVMLIEI